MTTTKITRSLPNFSRLTVADIGELLDGAPAHADVKFTEHRADPRDPRESTSYSLEVTWTEPAPGSPPPVQQHDHRPVQHRDARPPWCNECGLTAGYLEPKGRLDRP